ncbi:hypothetical protein WJX82_000076 [Trebouxia sp. C0006]
MAEQVETASPVHLPAKDDADGADGLKPAKSKRKGKKARKPFLPLPTLEAAQHKLPWQLAFSQSPLPEDITVSMTAPVHALVLQISLQTKCDPVLLRFILELDAHTKHAPAADTPSPGKAPCSDAHLLSPSTTSKNGTESDQISHGTQQVPGDSLDVITCTRADVDALLSPWDRNQKDWREALTEGCKELQQAIIQAGKYKPGTLQQLHFLAACINANAHATGHQEDTNSETGLGLYPVLSMFNHSCVPNLAHSSVGTVQYVYAVHDIKKGEQLCVHYTSLYEPRRVRQQALLQEKFFTCACERCSTPVEQSVDRFLEGFSCGKGQCREVMLMDKQEGAEEDVFKCVGCGHTTPARTVEGNGPLDVEKQADDMYHHAVNVLRQQGSGAARPVFEQLLDQCQAPGKLHSMHVRIIDSYMPLSNGCRRTGETVSAVRNVNNMISAMGFYYPHPCIEVTNLYRYLVELYADWAGSAASPKLAARPKRQARETYQKYCALRLVCQGRRNGHDDLATKLRMM